MPLVLWGLLLCRGTAPLLLEALESVFLTLVCLLYCATKWFPTGNLHTVLGVT